jgi:hypothetical protein
MAHSLFYVIQHKFLFLGEEAFFYLLISENFYHGTAFLERVFEKAFKLLYRIVVRIEIKND